MELCSASTGGDSSQNFPDPWRKLCRSRTGEAAGRLQLEVHRPVDGAMKVEIQARSSLNCGGSSAGPALVKLQEDSSQKFTDLWMKLCRASTAGDSSQKCLNLWRRLKGEGC